MKRLIIFFFALALCSCGSRQALSYAPDAYWLDSYQGPYGIQVSGICPGQSEQHAHDSHASCTQSSGSERHDCPTKAAPTMLLAGLPLHATGLNCYDLLVQCHEADSMATTQMEQTVEILEREQVPIVRFSVLPFHPHQFHYYSEQKAKYLANLEHLATLCDSKHILLVPSFFWHTPCQTETNSESLEAIGTPGSKAFAQMQQITREIVEVLKGHKCIAAWEYGNELNLAADISNVGHPKFTMAQLNQVLSEFGRIVREADPHARLICTGHGQPRDAQWHLAHEDSWTTDSYAQYEQIVGTLTPDPMQGVSEHIYESTRTFSDLGPQTKLQTLRLAKQAAAANGKVLYLGEFTGAACDDILRVRDSYECIVAAGVQLSFQWNYALRGSVEWSFSADSEKGKQGFELMRFYNDQLKLANLTPCQRAQSNTLRTASIFSDHAVLQRESQVPIWGWAKPGVKVRIRCSWDGALYSTTTKPDGTWRTTIATPEAGGPHSITIVAQRERIELSDLMSGEVWLCSGQSNMAMNIAGFAAQVPEGALDEVLQSSEYAERIRVYNIRDRRQFAPQDTLSTRWSRTDPATTAVTTAIGYKFAKRLTRLLGVPVGIIDNSWGGSTIEPWISEEAFTTRLKDQISASSYATSVSRVERSANDPWQIGSMHNTRLHPIFGYGIAGFLWYQGCGNRGGYDSYALMQAEMVREWREAWGDTTNSLPFYFTTIAPFYYWGPERVPTSGYFVENQLSSLDLIPNSGAAITQTLGEKGNIHPWRKQEIADQFILMAAPQVYGISSLLSSGFPYPDEVVFPSSSGIEEQTIRQSGFSTTLRKGESAEKTITVHFANAPLGMMHHNEFKDPVLGFEVAGPDRIFHPVKAGCLNNCVYLDCASIPNPVAVRYAFYNYADCNLESTLGVPVPAFRTDSWPEN